jgi:hypothetical protein
MARSALRSSWSAPSTSLSIRAMPRAHAASPRGVTAGLATAAALRAFGSAAAVAFAPRVVAEAGIGWLGGALAASLAALAVLRLAGRWSRSAAGRGVGVATARDL